MPSKAAETSYLESFLRSQGNLQFSGVQSDERPDFLARAGARTIGIEVTRFSPAVKEGHLRPDAQTSLRDRTMNLAREAYYAAGGVPLHVHAIFNSHPPLTKRRAPHLAREIANFLRARSPSLTLYQSSDLDNRNTDSFLPEIAALQALRVRAEEHGAWYDGEGAWVRHADERDVACVVMRKEPRVPQYRQRCDELWLLIVFEQLAGGTHVEPPTVPVDFCIHTGFDRVFCLSPAGDRCVEVPVARNIAA